MEDFITNNLKDLQSMIKENEDYSDLTYEYILGALLIIERMMQDINLEEKEYNRIEILFNQTWKLNKEILENGK